MILIYPYAIVFIHLIQNNMEQGYCVKCKAKSGMADAEKVTMKNGRPAMKGKCEKCGTGMYKILPKEQA